MNTFSGSTNFLDFWENMSFYMYFIGSRGLSSGLGGGKLLEIARLYDFLVHFEDFNLIKVKNKYIFW